MSLASRQLEALNALAAEILPAAGGRLAHIVTAPDASMAARPTVHTVDAASTVSRLISVYPAEQQIGVRLRLADEPLRVYLTCYRVLRANDTPRAGEVLAAAYHLLQERAATIEDADLRCSYLENVAAHREIVSLWEETSSQ